MPVQRVYASKITAHFIPLLHLLQCRLVFLSEHLLRLRWRDGSVRDSRVGEGTRSLRIKKWHVQCFCMDLYLR